MREVWSSRKASFELSGRDFNLELINYYYPGAVFLSPVSPVSFEFEDLQLATCCFQYYILLTMARRKWYVVIVGKDIGVFPNW